VISSSTIRASSAFPHCAPDGPQPAVRSMILKDTSRASILMVSRRNSRTIWCVPCSPAEAILNPCSVPCCDASAATARLHYTRVCPIDRFVPARRQEFDKTSHDLLLICRASWGVANSFVRRFSPISPRLACTHGNVTDQTNSEEACCRSTVLTLQAQYWQGS
jgi:hypothetical protein